MPRQPAKRFDDVSDEIVGAVRAGASYTDAARAAGVAIRTAERWLERGRGEKSTKYAEFAAAIDEARELRGPAGPMSEDELFEVVSRAARKGSVPAMKLYWEMVRADEGEDEAEEPKDPLERLDELAQRRRRAG